MTTRRRGSSLALPAYAALTALALLATVVDVARPRALPPVGAESPGGADFFLIVGGATLMAGALVAVVPSSARTRVLVGLSVAAGAVGLLAPVILASAVDPASLLGPALRVAISGTVCGLAIGATLDGRRTG